MVPSGISNLSKIKMNFITTLLHNPPKMSGFNCKKLKEENPTKYVNLGKPWKDDEIAQLLSEVQKKMSHDDIAEAHGRTVGSISSRLKTIAADYHFNDKLSIEQIIKYTHLSHHQVNEAISKRQYEIDKKSVTNKTSETKPAPQAVPLSPATQPLKEEPRGVTGDDFYNTMNELLVVAKDIQRMMKDFHADTFVSR
jgi:hypothetical protein